MSTYEKKFLSAVQVGNEDTVKSMLETGGVDVNMRDVGGYCRTPLIWAAVQGYDGIVKLLLEAGADKTLTDSEDMSPEDNARKRGRYKTADTIKTFTFAEKADEVIFRRQISNRLLEEIFDFKTLERITFVRDGRSGPVEGMVREGFSMLEDKSDTSMLRQAFNEHVKRGGQTPEDTVFGRSTLNKSKLKPNG